MREYTLMIEHVFASEHKQELIDLFARYGLTFDPEGNPTTKQINELSATFMARDDVEFDKDKMPKGLAFIGPDDLDRTDTDEIEGKLKGLCFSAGEEYEETLYVFMGSKHTLSEG